MAAPPGRRRAIARAALAAALLSLAGCPPAEPDQEPPPQPEPEAEARPESRSESADDTATDDDAGREAEADAAAAADAHTLTAALSGPVEEGLEWVEPDDPREISEAELAAHEAALRGVAIVGEFHETYPDAVGYFQRFHVAWADRQQRIPWYSRAYLNGRYELTMRLPVKLTDGGGVERAGEPEFYLVEFRQISEGPGPGFRTHIGRTGVFGEVKWRELREAGGRLERVLDDVRTNEPVEGFDDFAEHRRLLYEGRLAARAPDEDAEDDAEENADDE